MLGTWSFFATGSQELQHFLSIVSVPSTQVEMIVDEEWVPVIVSWLHKQLHIKEKYVKWQDTWEMDMSRVDQMDMSRLAEGVAPIQMDYADIIDRERKTEDSDYHFVKYCIRYSPSACVYVNHKPVSWAMMNLDGSIGKNTNMRTFSNIFQDELQHFQNIESEDLAEWYWPT